MSDLLNSLIGYVNDWKLDILLVMMRSALVFMLGCEGWCNPYVLNMMLTFLNFNVKKSSWLIFDVIIDFILNTSLRIGKVDWNLYLLLVIMWCSLNIYIYEYSP